MPTALILGVLGQDGSYLADSLLQRGYTVVGVGRSSTAIYDWPADRFHYVPLDLCDAAGLETIVSEVRPDVAFHVAAVHGAIASGFAYEAVWREVMQVNVLALHVLLEHARTAAPAMRIIYAGSAKVFPAPWQGLVTAQTPMRATCLYGISKLAARDLMRHYRHEHGVRSTNLVLFNHDSPRRPSQFLLPKLGSAVAAALDGRPAVVTIRTLDFLIDWSAADEIMGMVADIAAGPDVDELIVASGRTVKGRDIATALFERHNLRLEDHVLTEQPDSDTGPAFQVDIGDFIAAAGRRPRKTALDIGEEIVTSLREY